MKKQSAKGPARKSKPEPRKLTDKQGAFALRYLVHHNATRAAIEAGYSAATAAVQGYQLLQNPLVRQELDRLHAEQADRLKIDADRLLVRLTEGVNADLADIIDDAGGLKPISEWPLAWRRGLVAGIEVEEEYDDEAPDEEMEPQGHGGALRRRIQRKVAVGRVAKVKLADRTRIMELLGRHQSVQAWKDRKVHEAAEPLMELYRQIAGQSIKPGGAS